MRELAIIKPVFEKALFEALESNATQITNIHLALGEISELKTEDIQRAWNTLSKDTPAERAQLHIRLIEAEVQCMACFEKYHPLDEIIHCPYCGSYGAKVLSGEEFYLESIELDHD